MFTRDELALVDEVINQLRPLTSKQVSDLSHQELGWQMVDLREDIPYRTALVSDDTPSEATLDRARELAAQLGW